MSMADLGQLIEALNASLTTRCRDENGDWRVAGKLGHIYAQPEGFYIYYAPNSIRMWNAGKKEMGFCKVTQDGDDEGFLLLNRLPTAVEAGIIRDRLGIRRRKVISDAERERLAKTAFRSKSPPPASGSANGGGEVS